MDWALTALTVLGALMILSVAVALTRALRPPGVARRDGVHRTLPPLFGIPTGDALPPRRGAVRPSPPSTPPPPSVPVAEAAPEADGNGAAPRRPRGGRAASPRAELADAPAADGATVRVAVPMEQTLQFLPGRLEVVEGDEPGQDIRLVRTWGEMPEITFGRAPGPRHRHVQLRSLTVSRVHARMRYEGERWIITNLSETNPTRVNSELIPPHKSRVLSHGDSVEMGEVVFRYWEG